MAPGRSKISESEFAGLTREERTAAVRDRELQRLWYDPDIGTYGFLLRVRTGIAGAYEFAEVLLAETKPYLRQCGAALKRKTREHEVEYEPYLLWLADFEATRAAGEVQGDGLSEPG